MWVSKKISFLLSSRISIFSAHDVADTTSLCPLDGLQGLELGLEYNIVVLRQALNMITC